MFFFNNLAHGDTPMGPKPRPKPAQWSLEKAKRESASKPFDDMNPRMPQPKERGEHGKFVPAKRKK